MGAKINTAGRYRAARAVGGFEIQDTSYPHPLGGRPVMNLAISSEWVAREYADYLNRCDAGDDVEPLDFLPWCGIWSSYDCNDEDGGPMPEPEKHDNLDQWAIEQPFHCHDLRAKRATDLAEKRFDAALALGNLDATTKRHYLRHPRGRKIQELVELPTRRKDAGNDEG